jgi:hypothetical protein
VKQPVPQLVPIGLSVTVPAAPPAPADDTFRLKVGILTPQAVPSQVALPIAGTGQAVHELPQVCTLLLDTHMPPQLWKPLAQAMPQLVPLQVAMPLAGTAQAVPQDWPQL